MAGNAWQSERLIYRAAEEEDEAFLTSMNHDFRLFSQAAPLIPTPQGKASGKFLREMLQKNMMGAIICLPAPAPVTTETSTEAAVNKPISIGMVALWVDEPEKMAHHRHAMFGLNIAAAYQNKGYGREAILWSLKFGFLMCNLHHIYLGVFGYNPDAKRLYERIGFVEEGRLREHRWFNGKYWDEIHMGLLDREWKEKYGGPSE